MNKKIKQEEMMKILCEKSKEIAELLEKSDSNLDAFEFFCFELVNSLNCSYYSVIGVLDEVKQKYRQIFNEVMEEEAKETKK